MKVFAFTVNTTTNNVNIKKILAEDSKILTVFQGQKLQIWLKGC